jgi:DNA repair ATPase RecN
MPEKANVSSVEGLDFFRSSLIIYLSKARPTVEEISEAIQRMRFWLQGDQRLFWENQLRARRRKLDDAQQSLFSARISNLDTSSSVEQMAVHRAKHALDEADEKLRRVKHWIRDYDSRVEPLIKELEKLHNIITHDMPKAVAYLGQAVKTLESYSGMTVPSASAGADPETTPPTPTEPAPAPPEEQP